MQSRGRCLNACLLSGTTESWLPMRDITYPSLRAYADRFGFRLRSFLFDDAAPPILWWQKYDIVASALWEYDRVVYVDADVLILEGASDLFGLASNQVAAQIEWDEHRPNRRYLQEMKRIRESYPLFDYLIRGKVVKYVCAGLVSLPSVLRSCMRRPCDISKMPGLGEQHFFNMILNTSPLEIVSISDAGFFHGTYVYDKRKKFLHFVGGDLASKIERMKNFLARNK